VCSAAAHAPAEHTGAGEAQGCAHAPQFAGSVVTLAQVVPHIMLGATHAATQCPDTQLVPAPQAMPQPPQFEASVATSTHAPPQVMVVPGQLATQVPAAQFGAGEAQGCAHAPQFFGSLDRVTQAPEQVLCPVAQAPPSGGRELPLSLPHPSSVSAMSANKASEVKWLRRMRASQALIWSCSLSCIGALTHLTVDPLVRQKNSRILGSSRIESGLNY
jgi:hypothetical protein